MLAKIMRFGAGIAVLVTGIIVLAAAATGPRPGPAQDGRLGFVVSEIAYGLAANGEAAASACPGGMSLSPREIVQLSPASARQVGENDSEFALRIQAQSRAVLTAPDGQNLCMSPNAGAPDPHHRTVTGDVRVAGGIDLDGQSSRLNRAPAQGVCAHDDFRSATDGHSVDNQFYRAVGCLNSFLPTGPSNSFDTEMLTGSWGILITLEGVENLQNDNEVTVGIYANADPIQLSPARAPVRDATYSIEPDPRFQTHTRGRIRNGVLTTDPADVRIHWVVNALLLERPIKDARLKMTIDADGGMDGYLAGYSPVEDIYDAQFGFRSAREGLPGANHGQLAEVRRREGSASGYALTAGHTCNGVYYALRQMADGHRDPATGACTSISTQYRVRAIPAFIVGAQTSDGGTEN